MNTSKQPILITDADLDGAGCALVLKWLGLDYELHVSKAMNMSEFLPGILRKYSDRTIYITDIDTSQCGDIVDLPNVKIFDHHATHVYEYKHATAHVKNYTSCTKLLYMFFKNKLKLTKEQRVLIELIDDYDSYQLKHSLSVALNNVFWFLTGNRTQQFIDFFNDGFHGFNHNQKNMLKLHLNKLSKIMQQLETYYGEIPFGKNKTTYKIISTTADYAINEIADHILKKSNADLAFIINLKRNSVCFRKHPNCKVHLGKLAESIAEGGGHEYAAGGKLTPLIIELMKYLQPFNHVMPGHVHQFNS